MTYMTEMDRLEMRCIFFLEGLWGTEAGTGPHWRSSRALGPWHHTLTICQQGSLLLVPSATHSSFGDL